MRRSWLCSEKGLAPALWNQVGLGPYRRHRCHLIPVSWVPHLEGRNDRTDLIGFLEFNDIMDVKNHLVHLKGGGIYDWMKTSMIYATHVFIYIMIISHTYISSALCYSFSSYFAVPDGRNCLKNQQYEKKVVFKFHFIISCPEYMTKLQRWYQIFKNIWWNTAWW